MIEILAENLVMLKQEFKRNYNGTSHIQEIIPVSKSDKLPIDEKHLKMLHLFAEKNPIYYNSYEQKISDIQCVVYEGDINEYWLNSIQHSSSRAPFSPTWILSAYLITLLAKTMDYKQAIDVGSGDGRIAYCAKLLGLETYGIEIDNELVDLQKLISTSTTYDFHPNCADATKFDYFTLNLTNPAFFIGGLAKMGGDILANSIIEKINSEPGIKKNTGMVFAGTFSKKYSSDDMSEGGWGLIIKKNNLRVRKTIALPTVWTFDQPDDTPYIFTEF